MQRVFLSRRLYDASEPLRARKSKVTIAACVWLRAYALQFIESFVPTLTRDVVQAAVSVNNSEGEGADAEPATLARQAA